MMHTRVLLALTMALAAVQSVVAVTPAHHLRSLLASEQPTTSTPQSAKTVQVEWTASEDTTQFAMKPIKKIVGDEAVVVYYDTALNSQAASESATVTFDVRTSANCVVSICGGASRWVIGSQEQCFDLFIAPKSSDASGTSVIRGVKAAYDSNRQIASQFFLKFDGKNFIDGSLCEYEVISGTKTVSSSPVATGSSAVATS
ncbi:TPA: hypothetical protein N0F65_010628 [Lagenidium giganteum]|uniref:Uncharacterized protein n=1 Tax=Lagenidium giganteum TaxID=4803 RepID=A0AAV2ZDB2_9STRA|nr:TPA: hypothetical protein N0F65_010628 [Lagenidium giganteum]